MIETLAVESGGAILSGRIGFLPQRQGAGRANPMREVVREVQVATESRARSCASCPTTWTPPPRRSPRLYKHRWAIELFFRWVKQVLKITRFLGPSDNAVRIQIAVALIAFLLLRLARAGQKTIASPLRFARLVRANLMLKKPLDRLLNPEPTPIGNPHNSPSNGNSTKPDSRGTSRG